jgi:hypothetical protein
MAAEWEEAMRKKVWVIGALAMLAAAPAARAEMVVYKTALGGGAEAPPVTTAGSGTAVVNVDTATKQLSWQVTYAGLSGPVIGAHIHCGAPAGVNAQIAVPLGAPPNLASPIQGSGGMTDTQMQQLQSGLCYVNIHTDKNRPGEIRGQLTP